MSEERETEYSYGYLYPCPPAAAAFYEGTSIKSYYMPEVSVGVTVF